MDTPATVLPDVQREITVREGDRQTDSAEEDKSCVDQDIEWHPAHVPGSVLDSLSLSSAPSHPEAKKTSGQPGSVGGNVRITDVSIGSAPFDRLQRMTERKHRLHVLCERHYTRRERMFTIPSIMLTSSASLLSFVLAAYPKHEHALALCVGIVSSVGSMVVALSTSYNNGARAAAHRSAAEAYDRLRSRLFFSSLDSDRDEKDDAVLFAEVEQLTNEIKTRNRLSDVPTAIEMRQADQRHAIYRASLQRNLDSLLVQRAYEDQRIALARRDVSVDVTPRHGSVLCCCNGRRHPGSATVQDHVVHRLGGGH